MPTPTHPSTHYLDAAEAAARWIRTTAHDTPHGLAWLPEPDHPERAATVTAPAAIYSGNAGIVLFFLELARVTGDATYLDEARRGADNVAATWRDVFDFNPPEANHDHLPPVRRCSPRRPAMPRSLRRRSGHGT